jgi:ferredoxin--NADP+ reductase
VPYVVTQSCCSDASCVFACPVNCIHPTPDEPDFATAEMLYVDPDACVDCGACVTACPVDAIVPAPKLAPTQQPFLQINADFYKSAENLSRSRPTLAPVTPAAEVRRGADRSPLRVAIVGSGPAAMYAADELLTQPGVRVNVFDRLPTPGGLVRAGVAPDHQRTKRVTELFDTIADQDGFRYFLNVAVPVDVSHDELLDFHHAVVYAVGAATDRRLGVPGETLPGCTSGTDFVAWYNGHPDHASRVYDLLSSRAVVIGNGNVAIDVARILTSSPSRLSRTDIAAPAFDALRESRVEEVVLVARRGLAQSAFTVPEFVGLLELDDIDVLVDAPDDALDVISAAAERDGTLDHHTAQKLRLLAALPRYSADAAASGRKRIVLRYLAAPTAILGSDRVAGVSLERNALSADGDRVAIVPTGESEVLDAGLVLTSIGYKGIPLDGLPFDDERGVIPNSAGRVLEARDGSVVPGKYVAGWIKRGPTGFIGTNKSCAQETIRSLVDDYNAGQLREPTRRGGELEKAIRGRQANLVTRSGWDAIDRAERIRGAELGRPRLKITDRAELLAVAAAS